MDASTAPDVMSGLSADQLCDVRREHKDEKIAKHLGELTPISCKYLHSSEVLVTLTTATGDLVSYTLRAKMLVQSINQLVGLIHNNFSTIDIDF
jgi:hypothetical protein